MGILGPVIRAKVGDRIKVVFKNKASFPYSMHPHGVVYSKSAEGASYNDGTSAASGEAQDDSVSPGQTFEYVWDVPEEAGPGPNDLDTKLWMYHSHVSEGKCVSASVCLRLPSLASIFLSTRLLTF